MESGIDPRPTLLKDDILKTQRKDQNFRMKKRKREERVEAIKPTENIFTMNEVLLMSPDRLQSSLTSSKIIVNDDVSSGINRLPIIISIIIILIGYSSHW